MDYSDLRHLLEKAKQRGETITIITEYDKGKDFVSVTGKSINVDKTLSPWIDHCTLIDLATLLNNANIKNTLNGRVGYTMLTVEF